MAETRVWVFFYGSYMNLNVLREVGLQPKHRVIAKANGFDIVIQPRANLVLSDRHCVYGVLANVTHAELTCLYTHAKDVLGETYLPEAILIETLAGYWKPALCYIAPVMQMRVAANDYIDLIVETAREYDFPQWYVARLESFRP